jgi:hypothetical protein
MNCRIIKKAFFKKSRACIYFKPIQPWESFQEKKSHRARMNE